MNELGEISFGSHHSTANIAPLRKWYGEDISVPLL